MYSKTLLTSVMVASFAWAGMAQAQVQQVLAAAYSTPNEEVIVVDGFRYRVEYAHIQRRPDSQVVTGRILFLPIAGRQTTVDYLIRQRDGRITEITTSPFGPGRLVTVVQSDVNPNVLRREKTWQTVARFLIAHLALNVPPRPAGDFPKPATAPKEPGTSRNLSMKGGSGDDRITVDPRRDAVKTSARLKDDAHQGVQFVSDAQVVLPATITLECNGKNYEISTGDNTGHCQRHIEDGVTKKGAEAGAICEDSKGGTRSEATCSDGCSTSVGAGTCKVTRN